MQQHPSYCQDAFLAPIVDFSLNYSQKTAGSTLLEGDDRRKPSSKSGHWTHWFYRWTIDRITDAPYNRSLSRLADRLLLAIEGGDRV